MSDNNQTVKREGLKIVREFKAPRNMVFDAFSTSEALSEWWGPVGMDITVAELDFNPGGKFHYKMEGHGQQMWGLFKFKTIDRADLLEFVSSFSDEAGNVCTSPFPMDFPLEILNQMTFSERNGITTLVLQGYPINATPEQINTYHSIIASMQQGFGGTFDQLEVYLAKIRSQGER